MKLLLLAAVTATAFSPLAQAETNTFVSGDCQSKIESVLSAMRSTKVTIQQETLEYNQQHALVSFNAESQAPGKADLFLQDVKDVARGQFVYLIQCNLNAVQIYNE